MNFKVSKTIASLRIYNEVSGKFIPSQLQLEVTPNASITLEGKPFETKVNGKLKTLHNITITDPTYDFHKTPQTYTIDFKQLETKLAPAS